MRANTVPILLLLLPSLALGRDPFAAPEMRCQSAAAAQWSYRGQLSEAGILTAFLQNAEGKWQRVRVGDTLVEGLIISDITRTEVAATTQQHCLPGSLRWVFQEKKHEGNHRITVTSVAAADRVGKTGKSRLADRGRGARGAGPAGAGRQ